MLDEAWMPRYGPSRCSGSTSALGEEHKNRRDCERRDLVVGEASGAAEGGAGLHASVFGSGGDLDQMSVQ